MSIILALSSDSIPNNTRTDDFTVTFSSPIEIFPKNINLTDPINADYEWQVAVQSIDTWYSWSNISPQFTNQTFTYSPDGGTTWKDIVVEQGTYSLQQLNTLIKAQIELNGDDPNNISIVPNFSTGKVIIGITAPYQVDLSTSDMYLLFGFTTTQPEYPILTATADGENVGNINNSVNSVVFHCSIVDASGSYNSKYGSDVLYTFVPQSPPYSNITITPNERTYVPIQSGNRIDKVRVYLTDQLGRRIDLRGEPLTVVLHLRAVEKLKLLSRNQI